MPNELSVRFIRSGLVEREHKGYLCHLSKKSVIYELGDNRQRFFLRSCMKPLQAACIVDFNLDFDSKEIAVCAASHTGEKLHIELVRSILSKNGFSNDDLLCPPELPLSETAQKDLLLKNEEPQRLHSNCSGKHAMMLAVCKKNGWSTKDYDKFEHPIQKHIYANILKFIEYNNATLPKSLDGCGLPVYALTLRELCKSFINLFSDPKYEILKEAIANNPYIAGGIDRLDSEIINASNGKLIAKVGAGGLIVIYNIQKQEAVAIKIADASTKARAIAAIKYLTSIGWLSPANVQNTRLNDLADKKIITNTGVPLGEAICVF